MSTLEKLTELEARRLAIQNSYDPEVKKAIVAKGKLIARERITNLLDENTFVEVGSFVKSRSTAFNMNAYDTPADGVVCGYGTINGNLTYVYSQDSTVIGGAIGEMHAKKITRIYDEALKVGAPIIGFIDTAGIRLQESVDALEGYGAIYSKCAQASGVVPQIMIICGDCAGGASFISGFADFTFISKKSGRMFLNSPNAMSEEATFDNIATPEVHLKESGLAQFGGEDELAIINEVKDLITYLPSNNDEGVPCYACEDDLNRVAQNLNTFDFKESELVEIVSSIADNYQILEVSKDHGTSAFTGFIRMNGATVGVIGNQSKELCFDGVKKITQFTNVCDAFEIPLLSLTNIVCFESTAATEQLGIAKEVTRMINSFTKATVPKVNVILEEAYGSAYVAMNSKHIGADYVYAWPTATVATMNKESAIKIMYADEIQASNMPVELMAQRIAEFENQNNSYGVAARGYIDDIIEPSATRKRVIAALETLSRKQVERKRKKHSTV